MNPILNKMSQNNALNMMNMVRSSGNPNAMLNQLSQSNPQLRQAMDFARQVGDPKEAFYQMARQRGIDPEVILSQLR